MKTKAKMQQKSVRPYTIGEEIWHCTIHGMGIILSVAGLVILAALSAIKGNAWTVVSTVIFGVSMVMLYTASSPWFPGTGRCSNRKGSASAPPAP